MSKSLHLIESPIGFKRLLFFQHFENEGALVYLETKLIELFKEQYEYGTKLKSFLEELHSLQCPIEIDGEWIDIQYLVTQMRLYCNDVFRALNNQGCYTSEVLPYNTLWLYGELDMLVFTHIGEIYV